MSLRRTLRKIPSIHVSTLLAVSLVTGIMFWANLRPTEMEKVFADATPDDLDMVTRTLFWRGWPLSPCMFGWFGLGRFHNQGAELATIVDATIFLFVVIATGVLCEKYWGRRRWRASGEDAVATSALPSPSEKKGEAPSGPMRDGE